MNPSDPTPDVAARTDRAATDPPAALVELCARALAAEIDDDVFTDPVMTGSHWDASRDVYRHDARTVLAALFAASEVRARFRVRYLDFAGNWCDTGDYAEAAAREAFKVAADLDWPSAPKLIRRIVLTLPAETIPETTGNIDGGQSE